MLKMCKLIIVWLLLIVRRLGNKTKFTICFSINLNTVQPIIVLLSVFKLLKLHVSMIRYKDLMKYKDQDYEKM